MNECKCNCNCLTINLGIRMEIFVRNNVCIWELANKCINISLMSAKHPLIHHLKPHSKVSIWLPSPSRPLKGERRVSTSSCACFGLKRFTLRALFFSAEIKLTNKINSQRRRAEGFTLTVSVFETRKIHLLPSQKPAPNQRALKFPSQRYAGFAKRRGVCVRGW